MMFLRQCGTYPGRDVSLGLVCFWSAALRTRADTRRHADRLYLYLLPIPARTTYNLMDVMSCLPDLRRCATRLV